MLREPRVKASGMSGVYGGENTTVVCGSCAALAGTTRILPAIADQPRGTLQSRVTFVFSFSTQLKEPARSAATLVAGNGINIGYRGDHDPSSNAAGSVYTRLMESAAT